MPRNFAIRLRCPQGDCDSWVTLLNREESLEQILEQTWDFKCREHGPQNSVPQEAMEVAPLDNPEPSPTPVSFAVPLPATPAKKTPRSSERISLRVPLVITVLPEKAVPSMKTPRPSLLMTTAPWSP